MVVDWGAHSFSGIYPGGQSENPASSWYTNRVTTWWDGTLRADARPDARGRRAGAVTWSLQS